MNVFFCLLFKKCTIKQLLNSVFAWYHELSKPRVCIICLSLRLRQITQTSVLIIHDIMLNKKAKKENVCLYPDVSFEESLQEVLFFIKNSDIFWMNKNLQLLYSTFVWCEELCCFRPSASMDNILLDRHNSSYHTQPRLIIANYYVVWLGVPG